MRIVSFIVVIATLSLFGVGLYLVIQNRNSPILREKAVPAIIIAVVAALFTIWFSLKKESIKRPFTSTVFVNISDKNPLDYHENKRLLFGGEQFDAGLLGYIGKTTASVEGLTTDHNNVNEQVIEFYMDMLTVKVISHFIWLSADWWHVHLKSIRRGTSTSTELSANKPAPPCSPIKWNDWLRSTDSKCTLYSILKDYSDDFWIKKMVVPPQTKVLLHSEQNVRKILFENKFVDICITVRRRSGSRGLGDYQLLLGYDHKRSDSFWSEHFEVTCNAYFEKLRSGHPEMDRYIRWAKTMFTELEYRLDDKQRMERALEYRNLIKLSQ